MILTVVSQRKQSCSHYPLVKAQSSPVKMVFALIFIRGATVTLTVMIKVMSLDARRLVWMSPTKSSYLLLL